MAAPAACTLCGLPVPDGGDPAFCCTGCRNVFEILSHLPGGPPADFRDTDLFRTGAAAGLVAVRGDTDAPEAAVSPHAEKLVLHVGGMWCPSCAWWLEEMLRRTDGVVGADVSFAADRATLFHLPQKTGTASLVERISRLGYRASALDERPHPSLSRSEALRLGVSAILTANLMMVSMGLYGGFFSDLGPSGVFFLSLPQFLLATPVVFYGGLPLLRRAGWSLRARTPSMDLLLALGALAAWGYSVGALASGSLHLYFDTAATLVTLALVGRTVEARLKDRVARENEFPGWEGRKACLVTPTGERWTAAEGVNPGDEFRVRAGERAPADGRVAAGGGGFDESTLTGEARPVRCRPGSPVLGGALLVDGDVRVTATTTARDGAAGRLVAATDEALTRKLPTERLAEQWTRRLVPGVVLLAACAAVGLRWAGYGVEVALVRALTVLVITCPCALGLAIPLAKVAAVRSGRARGLVIRDPSALERLGGLDTVVFDKTGTLTEGKFVLRQFVADGATRDEAASVASSLALVSTHPLARELVGRGGRCEKPREGREVEGRGVTALVGGEPAVLGNRGWLEAEGLTVSAPLAAAEDGFGNRGWTTVLVGWGGRARGVFGFGDELKEHALDCVTELRRRGVSVELLSGDSHGAAAAVAGALGIEHFAGRAVPEDKAAAVRGLRRAGRRVAFVGDGVNDGPALAEADVGLALGRAPLSAAADLVLVGGDPRLVLDAFDHARLASRVMRQNLFFAFGYNALAVPLALSGLLTPLVAALAMFASSLTVVANTLRVGRLNRKREFTDKGEAEKGSRLSAGPNSTTMEVG